MSRDDEILLDLVRACRLILDFTSGMNKEAFSLNIQVQSSVLYQIVILGEAVNRLSNNFKEEHPEIPFAEIRGMRNRVTHEYHDVDFDIVWKAIQVSIPELLIMLEPLVPKEDDLIDERDS
jgi:uncharacterized protein with HEPN domain